jgi:hypothetical protein
MHHSRLCAVLIDCKTSDVDEAAAFGPVRWVARWTSTIRVAAAITACWRPRPTSRLLRSNVWTMRVALT